MIQVDNNELNRNIYINEKWTLRTSEYIFIFNSQEEIQVYLEDFLEEGEDELIETNKVSIFNYLERLERKIDSCKEIRYIDRYKDSCLNTKTILIRNEGKKPTRIEIIGNTIYYYLYVDKKQVDRKPYVNS